MAENGQVSKICPSCGMLIPVNRLQTIISRSRGKITKTLRCHRCIENREIANKARQLQN